MLGIAWAFNYLGKLEVNAGASCSWVGRALHPFLGFLSGWALVISATTFMVAGSLPAGSMTLALFAPSQAHNTALITAVGAGWFLVMLGIVLMGARLTVHAQMVMSGIEPTILLVFAIAALFMGGAVEQFSWSWLGFGHFDGVQGFAWGALVAAFYYWGWDVTSNLGEETRNSRRAAGFAGLIAVVVAYRKLLFKSPANFFFGGLWPLSGALFMFWIFIESLGTLDAATIGIGLGGLAIGLVPMVWYWRQGSAYYRPARLAARRSP